MQSIQTSLNNKEYAEFQRITELLFNVGLIEKKTSYAASKFLIKYGIRRVPMDLEAIARANSTRANGRWPMNEAQ